MRAVEFITEAFNQPYPLQWEPGDNGDYDALATLGDGKYLSIMFNHEGDNEWHVEFWRNNSVGVTGEGDAQRVFATVLSAMQQFIQKQQPKRIVFSANKDVEPGQNSESRAKLYNSLVARYARAWGYDASNQDHGHEVIYELTRLKQDVTELFNPKDSLRLRWDNTFGPVERHAQARFDDNWLDISFVPSNEKGDVVEIAFARNDRWDVSGEGDEYKIFSTVIQAIREYLMSYQPKILYFSSKGQSRTRLYQSLINRLAQSYGYKQFDLNKLSQAAREKIGLSGSDVLVLRKSYDQQSVAEGTADDINKMFGNMYDANYAALQRVALLAMQGRQDEAMSQLNRVIKDTSPVAQKKIVDAVNNIKPVTIKGKVADSSTLDKSEQHQQWIKQTFIPWVESLL